MGRTQPSAVSRPHGFYRRNRRLKRLGATLYETPPGAKGSPYHFHHANEEMIIVLSGKPTLRPIEGTQKLKPGDVVACPAGPSGAHQLINDMIETVLTLVISTMNSREIAEMPDRDKVLVISHPPRATDRLAAAFLRTSQGGRLHGEIED